MPDAEARAIFHLAGDPERAEGFKKDLITMRQIWDIQTDDVQGPLDMSSSVNAICLADLAQSFIDNRKLTFTSKLIKRHALAENVHLEAVYLGKTPRIHRHPSFTITGPDDEGQEMKGLHCLLELKYHLGLVAFMAVPITGEGDAIV
ncbi:hypothetical protein CTRI78_v000667 [Colletotrichum trifolii]|uniref:Uncharacterized protein n=1 Tax=Colletotrichum trifolii TaxID=5466 RepID=A0A4R8RY02_COLTR|nr:hypothetical protein CTRI78_v000667 [Colletotrichum trifolii]